MILILTDVHINIPVSQVGPANPSGHRQVAVDVSVTWHVPPLEHGCPTQGSAGHSLMSCPPVAMATKSTASPSI